MRVAELWRHPVKSFVGERLPSVGFEDNGVTGDRMWGIRDSQSEKILTGRREPRLLEASSTLGEDGQPRMTLPHGTQLVGTGPVVDEGLSTWLGTQVQLVRADELPRPGRAEFFVDATDDSSQAVTWTLQPKRFVDVDPILLVTTSTLRAGEALYPAGVWDVQRFRPNVLVESDGDGWIEDFWVGKRIRIGEVVLQGGAPCNRCTMVTRPQPGPGLERDLDIFRTLAKEHRSLLGLWCVVAEPGTAREGDEVTIEA